MTPEKFKITKGGDEAEVTILPDGTYRVDFVGSVSATNHGSADQFTKEVERRCGGTTEIISHAHGAGAKVHSHGGTTHSH